MRFFLLFFILFQSFSASANMHFYFSGPISLDKTQVKVDRCDSTTNLEEIKALMRDLISDYFPNLEHVHKENRLKIREFESEQYFFKTFFKLGHILKDKRVYFIDVNTKLYECAPSKQSLVAILAHELKHIDDYQNFKSYELFKLGLKMIQKKSRSEYERATDYHVMGLGLATGIKEYRNWIYNQLTQKALNKKKCYYYTPEEINRFLQGERDFSDYFNKYCKF